MINEDIIIRDGEESAGLSVKGHYSKEDGVLTRLLATETIEARCTGFRDRQLVHIHGEIETTGDLGGAT